MYEVKGDPLEAELDMVVAGEELAELREEIGRLKAQVAAQASTVKRPALSGAKADVTPEHKAFVDGYLHKGAESAIERKSFNGGSDVAGGYAVPEEIDAAIDAALKAVSPIRAIANVVKVGSAGYRKLVTTGGTPSGWAGETGDRPETAAVPRPAPGRDMARRLPAAVRAAGALRCRSRAWRCGAWPMRCGPIASMGTGR